MSLPTDTRGASLSVMRRISGEPIPAPHPLPWRRQRQMLDARFRQAPARPPGGAPILQLGRLAVDLDAAFAFAITVAMLFISTLGTKGAAAIALLTPLYLFVRRRDLLTSFTQRAFLFAFPTLALCSVLWSSARGESLKYAVELLITVIAGVLFASAADKRNVVRAVALAFAAYVVAAVATGGQVAVGVGAGGAAFSGLTESKNLMADIAGTGLLITLSAIAISIGRRQWLMTAGFCVTGLLAAYALVAARSAGALMAVAVACAAFAGLLLLTRAGRAVRASATSMLLLIMVVAGLNFRALAQALIAFGASAFDKDPTLTGRTYLWYRAQDVMQQVPLLGRGYSAFWLQGNLDAEGLWRYAGIVGRGGFNFHNTVIDLRVTLGWLGVAVFFSVVAIGMACLIRRFVVRPSLPVLCWTSVALYEVSRMAIESIAFQQLYHPTLLLFTALGVGVGAYELAPRGPSRQRAQRSFERADYAAGAQGWNALARRYSA